VRGFLIWLPVIVALALPLIYSAMIIISRGGVRFFDSYWQSVMSEWLATIIGIAAGLPIGFWTNRRMQQEAEIRRKQIEETSRRQQVHRILTILLDELEENLPSLRVTIEEHIVTYPFHIARWQALSAGGAMRWVENVRLLSEIAEAYEYLEAVNNLSLKWIEVQLLPSAGAREEQARHFLKDRLIHGAAEDALEQVEQAITGIKSELRSLET